MKSGKGAKEHMGRLVQSISLITCCMDSLVVAIVDGNLEKPCAMARE